MCVCVCACQYANTVSCAAKTRIGASINSPREVAGQRLTQMFMCVRKSAATKMQSRNLTFGDLLAMPEQDDWVYPSKEGVYRMGKSMVCNTFVCKYVRFCPRSSLARRSAYRPLLFGVHSCALVSTRNDTAWTSRRLNSSFAALLTLCDP